MKVRASRPPGPSTIWSKRALAVNTDPGVKQQSPRASYDQPSICQNVRFWIRDGVRESTIPPPKSHEKIPATAHAHDMRQRERVAIQDSRRVRSQRSIASKHFLSSLRLARWRDRLFAVISCKRRTLVERPWPPRCCLMFFDCAACTCLGCSRRPARSWQSARSRAGLRSCRCAGIMSNVGPSSSAMDAFRQPAPCRRRRRLHACRFSSPDRTRASKYVGIGKQNAALTGRGFPRLSRPRQRAGADTRRAPPSQLTMVSRATES